MVLALDDAFSDWVNLVWYQYRTRLFSGNAWMKAPALASTRLEPACFDNPWRNFLIPIWCQFGTKFGIGVSDVQHSGRLSHK